MEAIGWPDKGARCGQDGSRRFGGDGGKRRRWNRVVKVPIRLGAKEGEDFKIVPRLILCPLGAKSVKRATDVGEGRILKHYGTCSFSNQFMLRVIRDRAIYSTTRKSNHNVDEFYHFPVVVILSDLKDNMREMQQDIAMLGTRVDDLEYTVEERAEELHNAGCRLLTLEEQYDVLAFLQEDLENRSRHNNVRIRGLPLGAEDANIQVCILLVL
ncbi:hypothetical protein NDU88_005421 [Pleurodeles waltl]|uniref:Uncharacterized protein n=1 Tax=Pleurodeles waltl TaxID=8319 RepID=A0AAV7TBX7_PLEWA|nr:hypothetical protein NDU88_005421 [Pleurodeles waltl]